MHIEDKSNYHYHVLGNCDTITYGHEEAAGSIQLGIIDIVPFQVLNTYSGSIVFCFSSINICHL